jgi:alpha-glucosidase
MSQAGWQNLIHHDGSPLFIETEELQIGKPVTIRLRAPLDAPLEKVFVRTAPDGEQDMTTMRPERDENGFRWWETRLTLRMPSTGYRFFLLTSEGSWWYNAAGIFRHNPTDVADFKLLANYQAPHWVQEAVFYQIFPDRFCDGDPTNNVQTGEYIAHGRTVISRQWGENPQPHSKSGSYEFFGGDLQGITRQLDYLQELGVNALYLNPIFTSPSNHKYDVANYKEVDPHFGGNAALIELRQETEKRGIRLLLDIVPNHTSVTHPWFVEAQASPDAESAEFFTFRDHPTEYETWLGVRTLPKLNYRSDLLRNLMYAGDEAIMRYWLRAPYRIDGWRVDVANMMGRQGEIQLGHKIGRAVRRAVKSENPAAYLLGEHFFDGTSHLQGEELDASMNYQGFTFPLWRWLSGFDMPAIWGREWADNTPLPTEALAAQWQNYLATIPWQIAVQQFNLLDSHDTPRIFSIAKEDPELVKIAAALLVAFPGVPCIYYGDEIGLPGA